MNQANLAIDKLVIVGTAESFLFRDLSRERKKPGLSFLAEEIERSPFSCISALACERASEREGKG